MAGRSAKLRRFGMALFPNGPAMPDKDDRHGLTDLKRVTTVSVLLTVGSSQGKIPTVKKALSVAASY